MPLVRDDRNRTTQITDPQDNIYQYSYGTNGNLASIASPATSSSVTCSGLTTPNTSQYAHYPNSTHLHYPSHYYASGTD